MITPMMTTNAAPAITYVSGLEKIDSAAGFSFGVAIGAGRGFLLAMDERSSAFKSHARSCSMSFAGKVLDISTRADKSWLRFGSAGGTFEVSRATAVFVELAGFVCGRVGGVTTGFCSSSDGCNVNSSTARSE